MKTLELNGAIAGLQVLKASDLNRYKRAVTMGKQRGFAYYFPYLLSHHRTNRSVILWIEDQDTLCLFLWRRRKGIARLELPVAPTPMNPFVLRQCLDRCNDYNRDRSARVLRIDELDAPSVASLVELRVEKRRIQYLYAPAEYADLGGRRFRTLRRNVAVMEARSDVEVLHWTPIHDAACRALLSRWGEQHRALYGTAGGVGTTRRALDLAPELSAPDMQGQVILIGGRVAALSFGGEIRTGVGCYFEAKCDVEVRGLSYFQRTQFLSGLTSLEMVNDGSDAGREGLRQIKQSLRPIGMHTEYRGFQ